MHNGYNYRTLNPWEQTALEHLSAIIGEIIGAGFENPKNLIERANDMILDLESYNENLEFLDSCPYTQQNWDNSEEKDKTQVPGDDIDEENDKTQVPGDDIDEENETQVPEFQDIDYETAPW